VGDDPFNANIFTPQQRLKQLIGRDAGNVSEKIVHRNKRPGGTAGALPSSRFQYDDGLTRVGEYDRP
jgi:hypothetical protein